MGVLLDFSQNTDVDVLAFLKKTLGQKLQYVDASGNQKLNDEAFVYFRGIRELHIAMSRGWHESALENPRGIRTLSIAECYHVTTDALVNLRGIESLDISHCNIKAEGFKHLCGIRELSMHSSCVHADEAFQNLRGIRVLRMNAFRGRISNATFENLRGVHTLMMEGMRTKTSEGCTNITSKVLQHLTDSNQELDLSGTKVGVPGDHLSDGLQTKLANFNASVTYVCITANDEGTGSTFIREEGKLKPRIDLHWK